MDNNKDKDKYKEKDNIAFDEYEITLGNLLKFDKNKDIILELLIDSNCLPFFDNCFFLIKMGIYRIMLI